MRILRESFLFACIELLALSALPAADQALPGRESAQASPDDKMDISAIVAKMAEHNQMRDRTLHTYACDRVYKVDNKRVNKSATVHTSMVYVEPDEKLFEVHSSSGMGFMRKGVLNRLIETERESSSGIQKAKTAMSGENYAFEYLRSEKVSDRLQYVLRVRARRKDKLLFNGTLWVDAEDFAVTRIEGRPAKNPSFWTRKVDFVQEYQKLGPYWFPARNSSVTQVFIFGVTTTEIEYANYQVNHPELFERAAELRRRGNKLEIQVEAKDK